jgi:hypothetical protein
MSDVVSEAPPAAGPPDRGVSADVTAAFGIHVRTTPPLTWLAVIATLSAMAINQVLLPALNDVSRMALLRELGRWGAFATNLATIAGGIALGYGLLAFVRYSSVMRLWQRLLLGFLGGLIFLPTLAAAALLESHTSAQTVLYAFATAQFLVASVSRGAARAADGLYPRVVACIAAAMALCALFSEVLLVATQLDMLQRVHAELQLLQRVFQSVGELFYLLLLTGMAALLMPKRVDRRSRIARIAAFFVLGIALGALVLAERMLDNDYALLLYHAQRVTLFIDAWPTLYSAPIGLALAGAVAALIAREAAPKQAAAGLLLLLGSGYAPHAPGRLLTWTLALVLIARAIIAPSQERQEPAAARGEGQAI